MDMFMSYGTMRIIQHLKLDEQQDAQGCPKAVNLVGYATHFLDTPLPPTYVNQQHIVYTGEDNNVYEYVYHDNAWHCTKDGQQQPKKLNGSYPARTKSALASYVTTYTSTAQQHVIYFGVNLSVDELVNDKGSPDWAHHIVSQGTALPTASSPLAGYVYDSQQHINFINMDNHVQELFYDHDLQQWQGSDVTAAATDINGGDVPHVRVGGQHLAGYATNWDDIIQQHLVFPTNQGHLYELYYYNGAWRGNNLTLNAVQNCAQP
jgi:hypothetical protein